MNFDNRIRKIVTEGARKEVAREHAWLLYAKEELRGGRCDICKDYVQDMESHIENTHGGKQKTLFEEAFGNQFQVSGGHEELEPRRYPNAKQPPDETLGDELNLTGDVATEDFTDTIDKWANKMGVRLDHDPDQVPADEISLDDASVRWTNPAARLGMLKGADIPDKMHFMYKDAMWHQLPDEVQDKIASTQLDYFGEGAMGTDLSDEEEKFLDQTFDDVINERPNIGYQNADMEVHQRTGISMAKIYHFRSSIIGGGKMGAYEDMITADKPFEMMGDSWEEVDNKKHQTMSLENKDEGTFFTHDGDAEGSFNQTDFYDTPKGLKKEQMLNNSKSEENNMFDTPLAEEAELAEKYIREPYSNEGGPGSGRKKGSGQKQNPTKDIDLTPSLKGAPNTKATRDEIERESSRLDKDMDKAENDMLTARSDDADIWEEQQGMDVDSDKYKELEFQSDQLTDLEIDLEDKHDLTRSRSGDYEDEEDEFISSYEEPPPRKPRRTPEEMKKDSDFSNAYQKIDKKYDALTDKQEDIENAVDDLMELDNPTQEQIDKADALTVKSDAMDDDLMKMEQEMQKLEDERHGESKATEDTSFGSSDEFMRAWEDALKIAEQGGASDPSDIMRALFGQDNDYGMDTLEAVRDKLEGLQTQGGFVESYTGEFDGAYSDDEVKRMRSNLNAGMKAIGMDVNLSDEENEKILKKHLGIEMKGDVENIIFDPDTADSSMDWFYACHDCGEDFGWGDTSEFEKHRGHRVDKLVNKPESGGESNGSDAVKDAIKMILEDNMDISEEQLSMRLRGWGYNQQEVEEGMNNFFGVNYRGEAYAKEDEIGDTLDDLYDEGFTTWEDVKGHLLSNGYSDEEIRNYQNRFYPAGESHGSGMKGHKQWMNPITKGIDKKSDEDLKRDNFLARADEITGEYEID